jgi:hypothetical protein
MSTVNYSSGLMLLQDVVNEAIWIAKRPDSDYHRFYQLAIRAYQDLITHVVAEGKKVSKMTVSDINTVDFPDDFVNFINIGVVSEGKIWLLTRNDDMITTTTEVDSEETLDADEGEGVDIPAEFLPSYYARGGGNEKGYYTIEWSKRRIKLANVTDETVLLSYLVSGSSVNGNTYVPVRMIPAIIAQIVYKDIAYDPNIPVFQKQDAKSEMLREENKLRDAEGPTLNEYEEALYATYYPLIKR